MDADITKLLLTRWLLARARSLLKVLAVPRSGLAEKHVERAAPTGLAFNGDFATQGFDLRLDQVQAQSFPFQVGMEPAVEAK
jgi:hypothetical protein